MTHTKLTLVATSFFLAGLFIGCSSGGNESESNSNSDSTQTAETSDAMEDTQVMVESEIYCLYDKASIRNTPNSDGKWQASMNLGETVTFLGETVMDSAKDREYVKVRLSDGKEGWAQKSLMLMEGNVAVTLEEIPLYDRPDLLTKNSKTLPRMLIVGVYNPQDDWTEIKGIPMDASWYTSGWTKSPRITTDEEDIAAALLIGRAMEMEDAADMEEALQSVVSTFPNSVFATDANTMLTDMAMMEGEGEEMMDEIDSAM